jgi:hypothetical protein
MTHVKLEISGQSRVLEWLELVLVGCGQADPPRTSGQSGNCEA